MNERDAEFLKLLNADSLLDFSLTEKAVYRCFYLGMSDAEISRKLKMPKNTVTSFRRRLRKLLSASIRVIAMCDMMGFDPSPRKYTAQKSGAKLILGMDESLRITGAFSKSEIHGAEAPVYHPSVIIVPYIENKNGIEFVICEKNRGIVFDMAERDGETDARVFADVLGGHFKAEKMPELTPGTTVGESDWLRAAVIELNEELRISGGGIREENLKFLFFDKTCRKLEGTSGINNEMSAVFAYRVGDARPRSVRIFDEYTDSLGELYKYRFPSRFVSPEEFAEIAGKTHKKYQPMDALQRVAARTVEIALCGALGG